MGLCMFAHFNADIATAHFVGDSGGSAGAEEAVQNYVITIRSNLQNSLDKTFWLRSCKQIVLIKSHYFLFRCLIITNFGT